MSDWEEMKEKMFQKNPELRAEFEESDRKMKKQMAEERKAAGTLFAMDEEAFGAAVARMGDRELMTHRSWCSSVAHRLEREYNRRRNESVFKTSKTTFRELLERNPWESLLPQFAEESAEGLGAYKRVYEELLSLPAKANAEKFVIHIAEDGDVSGVKPWDATSYSISCSPWGEWLGYFASAPSLEAHGEAGFIYRCLWDMTFYGYTQEKIQGEMQKTVEAAESYKAANPE